MKAQNNPKNPGTKAPAAKNQNSPAKPTNAPAAPKKVAPLFRKIDWLVLLISFGAVWTAYLLTLAPELTLEDSGELCTASFYAGIPHPPGYPFWAIYSWLWTAILPVGNVAWRVEVGESFAAAMACGLAGFVVSRGSSMLIEGIEELKSLDRKWENAICIVTGIVAGLLLGFDGFTWKESVVINRISLFDVPWIMLVVVCLLRWIYAPQQTRYLYAAMFFFGLCATIHQTLLVAAMGIEVVIAAAHPRFGRSFFLGNSIVFVMGLILTSSGAISAFNGLTDMLKILFVAVGVASIAGYIWFAILTKESMQELARDGAIATAFLLAAAIPDHGSFCGLLSLAALAGFGYLAWETRKRDLGWLVVSVCALFWMIGLSFYFYEAIAGMTDPPMQWGYPRTVEGFFHAISRGQYERVDPTDVLHDPKRFIMQLGLLIGGLADSYSWVCIFVALLPYLFIFKMQKRERAWIIGLTAIYCCIGVFLTILMNTSLDRQSADESKVVFTASHAIVAILIGYGLALIAAYMSTHYEKFRRWGFIGGGIAAILALYCLVEATAKLYFGRGGQVLISWLPFPKWSFWNALAFGPNGQVGLFKIPHLIVHAFAKDQYGLPVFANLILLTIPIAILVALWFYRRRGPVLIFLALLTAMPVWSGLSHWYKSEQRNHWFGYWFGHDMFTPPFIGPDGKFSYDAKLRAEAMKNTDGKLIFPEMGRDAIIFGGTDPGRFCPTYMIFCESFIPHHCQPEQDQNFDRRDCYLITQNALADGTYLDYLRAQYFRSQQTDPPFFSRLFRLFAAVAMGLGNSGKVVTDVNNPDAGKGDTGNAMIEGIASLLYNCLDKPLTDLGTKIEARRRAEGVYPPSEIYIPSPEDSQMSFQNYTEDVARRQQTGQLKPGESVNMDSGGRVQVSGQVAVMEINGLLCKVIFDHNPTNEFYVEESFPLDWMYPYETPFGIIMKVNRKPMPELTDDILKQDHEFWSKYSERLIGNWITYDTTVQQIADFAQKVYVGNNYAGFKGDRKFIRDDDAQKAFSKLRSSIAGMYFWRCAFPDPSTRTIECPPEFRQKSDAAQNALIRETDFAFKQAFAFCPYSPEAVYRYVNFLMPLGRIDDALIVAETCLKLDPFNDQTKSLVDQLREIKGQSASRIQFQNQLQQMQTEAAAHPTNFQNIWALGNIYTQVQDTNRALQLFNQASTFFDQELANPAVQTENVLAMAQISASLGNLPKLEAILKKLVVLNPSRPEARYDLAALESFTGKTDDALKDLRLSIDLSSKRLLTNPAEHNLLIDVRRDSRFDSIRKLPEFQKIVPPN